jgi:hypothetical protein
LAEFIRIHPEDQERIAAMGRDHSALGLAEYQ